MAFSEYHLHQLQEHSLQYSDPDDCPESERFTEVVGAVFRPRADMIAEAYETYCNGIKSSFRLLMELHEDPEFNQFLKVSWRSHGALLFSMLLLNLVYLWDFVFVNGASLTNGRIKVFK